ncbi:MAG: DUF1592 domain-containing protein [Myxococcota bacterium]
MPRRRVALALFALNVLSACEGQIGDVREPPTLVPDDGPFTPQGGPDISGVECATPPASVARQLPRLTAAQYAATIRDLLGVRNLDVALYPSEPGTIDVRGTTPLTVNDASGILDLAESISNEVNLPSLAGCNLGAGCRERFLAEFLPRAFRRPVTGEEIERFADLASEFATDLDDAEAFQLMLTAILVSPEFLYLLDDGEAGVLGPYATASRLSYFLWGSMPDAELLEAAASGSLAEEAGLRAEAERMLADPRAVEGLQEFTERWLDLPELPAAVGDIENPERLWQSMRESLVRSVLPVLLEGRYQDLHLSTGLWVDATLAAHLGLPEPDDWTFVEDPQQRTGILTHPAILMMTAGSTDDGRAIHRGVLILERILCITLGAPPANAAEISTTRHEDPRCAGCHTRIDPIGFAFAGYDNGGLGTDDALLGVPGEVVGSDANGEFENVAALSMRLSESASASACMTREVFRFGLGRPLEDGERCAADYFGTTVVRDVPLRDLILSVVLSHGFRHRIEEGDE